MCMADLVRALAATGKAASDLVAVFLILLGGLLMFGGYVYRVFVHPEWTYEQAVDALWPFFGLGLISVILGWLVDRMEGSSPGRP